MAATTPFEYTPLRHKAGIRILHLLPGEFVDPISGEIEHISLNEPSEYNALSYVWGSSKDTETISVSGQSFNITANLARALRALRALRKPDLTLPIWADAICINQADATERSDQVGRMRTVYERAAQVFIWLGEGTEMSKLGITLINKADTLPVENWSHQIVEHKGEVDFIKLMLLGLMDVFKQPWWERLWTVQELAVARNNPLVGCGDEWFSWAMIENLNSVAYESGKGEAFWTIMDGSGMRAIKDLVSIRNRVQEKDNMSLAKLTEMTIRRKYTEPLDQIYALLGLASPEVQQAIPIDYGKSLERLYTETARACIEIEGNMNMLSFMQNFSAPVSKTYLEDWQWEMMEAQRLKEKLTLVLPSWVPDWSKPFDQRHELLYYEGSYHASKGFKADVGFSEDLKILTAAGLQLDSVLVIHDEEYDSSKPKNTIKELGCTASAATQILTKDDAKREEDLADGFWRTLIANRTKTGEPAPAWWGEAVKVTKRESDAPEDFMPDLEPLDRFSKFVMPFQTQFIHAMLSRRFFVTERGYFGIGPMNMKRGDVVALVFGADMPMLVREQNGNWVLLGECYVHGFMDGEAFHIHTGDDEFPSMNFSIV